MFVLLRLIFSYVLGVSAKFKNTQAMETANEYLKKIYILLRKIK